MALQRKYGIKGFGDMTLMLSLIPRDMMELLRINTVIRSSSALLVSDSASTVAGCDSTLGIASCWRATVLWVAGCWWVAAP